MKLLAISNVSKIYPLGKNKSFTALKDINLSFEDSGFVSIVGKSGSGKSTLINLIARIDEPSKGDISLNKKKYTKKDRKIYQFYRKEIGVVFQNFNLLDNETTLYNAALPLLISGMKKAKAYSIATKTLRYVNLPSHLFDLKVSKLSGGEKQRLAIARALVHNPKILLCDEPTGALDSANSLIVMDILKNISKDKLVIMVSHNLQLADKYSDRIIELSDGRVINDQQLVKPINSTKTVIEKDKGKHNWTSLFSLKNFIKRLGRNAFVITSLSICMIMGHLVTGFINGKDSAIRNACYKQFDFGSGTISREEVVSNTGILKLTKSVRPSFEDLKKEAKLNAIYEICPNFSAILPQNIEISYDSLTISDVNYTPIYSFQNSYYDASLIYKGHNPISDTLDEIVINKKCYKKLKRILKKDPLKETLDLHYRIEANFVLEDGQYITDTFEYKISSKIVAIVDELDYLSTSKIYYSHIALQAYMQEYTLLNLSTYYDTKLTWYDRVVSAEDYSYLSSYSYLLFLKDYHYRNYLFKTNIISSDYSFSSSSIIIADSLVNFLEVAKYALILFLSIALIGAVLILSIISLTNYSEDRKVSAVLTMLGAKPGQIEDIYLNESMFSAIIAFLISVGLSFPFSLLANTIINSQVSISNIISIPYTTFLGIPFFYLLILLVVITLLVGLSTLIPIKFSKLNSVKTELQTND